jgi:hypothetical protein
MNHGSGFPRHCRWMVALPVAFGVGCSGSPGSGGSGPDQAGPPQQPVIAPVQEPAVARASSDVSDLPGVPEPTPSDPVKAVMVCRPSGRSTAELLVVIRIARAHYLHAEADHGGTFTPLRIEASLPPGAEFDGEWDYPAPEAGRVPAYRNTVLLRRSVKMTTPTPSQNATGVLRYQACNDELCWPRGKLELSAPLAIQTGAPR